MLVLSTIYCLPKTKQNKQTETRCDVVLMSQLFLTALILRPKRGSLHKLLFKYIIVQIYLFACFE